MLKWDKLVLISSSEHSSLKRFDVASNGVKDKARVWIWRNCIMLKETLFSTWSQILLRTYSEIQVKIFSTSITIEFVLMGAFLNNEFENELQISVVAWEVLRWCSLFSFVSCVKVSGSEKDAHMSSSDFKYIHSKGGGWETLILKHKWIKIRIGCVSGLDAYQDWTRIRTGRISGMGAYQEWTWIRNGHVSGLDVYQDKTHIRNRHIRIGHKSETASVSISISIYQHQCLSAPAPVSTTLISICDNQSFDDYQLKESLNQWSSECWLAQMLVIVCPDRRWG